MDVPPADLELLEEVHDMTHHGFHSLATLPVEVVNDSWTRRSLIGEKEMISWASMKKGYRANAHSHPHEQFIWVLAGAMEIRLGAEAAKCRLSFDERTVLTIPFEGFTYHRDISRAEVEALVECGLEPWEALAAATWRGGEILGEPSAGVIQEGGLPDFFLVHGDPLSDPAALWRVWKVA